MISNEKAVVVIAIAAICTFLTRAVPFLLFGGKKELPVFMKKLADILPMSIIAVLVIYCLKDTVNQNLQQNIVTLIACVLCALLHIWKQNTLLSIAVGTVAYMVGLHLI